VVAVARVGQVYGEQVRPWIDTALVKRLVAAQFPRWAGVPVRPVDVDGWDNRTYRLGSDMTVRLPSATMYVAQVEKEHRWLPVLAPRLPLPIPVPLAKGTPGDGYPFPWSVYRWIDGRPATTERIDDLTVFATDVADFLVALQRIDATGGPVPGRHNFFRGAPLGTYDGEVRDAVDTLGNRVPAGTVLAIWREALATTWDRPPIWFHGDVAEGNLLTSDGRLSAIIDFGMLGVGDPACDLVIAWNTLSGSSREAFRTRLAVDPATWARGRGWALWKALITYARNLGIDAAKAATAEHVIDEVLDEYRSAKGRFFVQ
jgi:aminoglycoside phosphotransferase (APT) family kinase protein